VSASATTPSFVAGSTATLVGLTAKTFGTRPSVLLGVPDPVVAYALDEAIALRLLFDEQRARQDPSKGSIPAGQRYEQPGDMIGAPVH